MLLLVGMKRTIYSFTKNYCKFTSQKENVVKIACTSGLRIFSIPSYRGGILRTCAPEPRAVISTSFRWIHGSARTNWNGETERDRGSSDSGRNLLRVKSWPFQLETPFGKLMMKETPFSARIVPTDPHDYPAGDRVFVHLLASFTTPEFEMDSSSFTDTVSRINCSSNEEGIQISCDNDLLSGQPNLSWVIEVPTCYDIDVTGMAASNISVESLENELCFIKTDQGNISLKSMTSAHVNVESNSGNVACLKAIIQGSGTITAQNNGIITADRLQGLDFDVSTESGAIHIKDIYSRKAQVSSKTGSVHISNMHTDCKIASGGDVFTGCVQGSMSVNLPDQASYTGYLSCHDDIDIQTGKGDIEIRLPEECVTHIDLSGQQVDLDSALVFLSTKPSDDQKMIGELNGGGVDAKIVARSKEGSITVKAQSWFDSLGLKS